MNSYVNNETIDHDLINSSGSFFARNFVSQEIIQRAKALATEDGMVTIKASHFLKAGLPISDLAEAGFRPTKLLNFQPRKYYDFWGIDKYNFSFEYREKQIANIGFAIITEENLTDLTAELRGRKVLDIGAGGCWLGERLKENGIDLKTLDLMSYNRPPIKEMDEPPTGYCFVSKHTPDIIGDVMKMDISEYNTFILCWADYTGGYATSVLRRMKRGDKLVWIGEDTGGCCGSNRFFRVLNRLMCKGKVRVNLEDDAKYYTEGFRYRGIHDYMSIYTRY